LKKLKTIFKKKIENTKEYCQTKFENIEENYQRRIENIEEKCRKKIENFEEKYKQQIEDVEEKYIQYMNMNQNKKQLSNEFMQKSYTSHNTEISKPVFFGNYRDLHPKDFLN